MREKTLKELIILVSLVIALPVIVTLIWNATNAIFLEKLMKTFCSTGWMVTCTYLCYKLVKTPLESLERPKKIRVYSTAVLLAWFISMGATILREFTDKFFI